MSEQTIRPFKGLPTDLGELYANCIEEGDCLMWQGMTASSNGMPLVRANKRYYSVRRLVLELAGVKVPKSHYAIATCGNPLCINRHHLAVRRPDQHYQQMAKAANTPSVKALRIGKLTVTRRAQSAKVTPEIAATIRLRDKPVAVQAKEHGISESTVKRIRSLRSWVDRRNPFSGLIREAA